MTKMQSMSGGSSGASEGLSAASRILKPPDTFSRILHLGDFNSRAG